MTRTIRARHRRLVTSVTLGAALTAAALVQPSMPYAAAAVGGDTDRRLARGWVTGTVVDGHGDPVAGALVNALNPAEVPEAGVLPDHTDRRATTDAAGHFRVRQAKPGYLVQVCQPEPGHEYACKETARGVRHLITYAGPAGVTDSWVTQTSLFRPTSTSRDLGAIRVKPQSFVHGRLMHAVFQHVEIQRLNGTTAYRTVTDADGDYRFRGLAPGPYRIAAGGNGTGWLPFLSPVIELRARHDSVVDGTLRRGATIHGVLSARGKPVAFTDVLVRREGADGGLVAATTTDRAGRYRVSGMAPATYTVGILYDGTAYQHKGVRVVVPTLRASVEAPIAVRKGATITVQFRRDGKRVASARDELRDSKGRWVAGLHNVDGQATYTGLRSGTYTIVGAEHSRFGRTVVTVRAGQTYDAGVVRLSRPTLTLTGTTAPSAVVEAFSGNNCPPDGAFRPGTFDQLATADASGRFRLSGLVPGRYMLGADGWPQNYVPRCVSDVSVRHDRTYDLPLQAGGTVTGRLVYAATGTPAITTLSYELTYPAGSSSNPTAEHPARAQTRQASGVFAIRGLRAATVTGALAQGAELDQINDPSYFVIYPFQDGTPYYLTSEPRAITIGAGSEVQLGDIPLTLHS